MQAGSHSAKRLRARAAGPLERRAVFVRGVVQGVGFRPFVFGLASRLELAGWVRNRADGVQLEVEGEPRRVARFLEQLQTECTGPARIECLETAELAPCGARGFSIEASETDAQPAERFFTPDLGTCELCLAELLDPAARRYRYPFTNCASCGPRFTIARRAPYDRERTTMAAFAMCAACRSEYEDPADRRFHAQPIACPECGPRLQARDADGRRLTVDPVSFFEERVRSGCVIAVKGLGGYHLACDATSEAAVRRLRELKHRDDKPFAVMVADFESARASCQVSAREGELLGSAHRPIVLLRRHDNAGVARAVAPNQPWLGLMLPYTPLHHVLVRAAGRPLVLTSGNRSDAPMVFEDADAVQQLRGIADAFLMHDRAIQSRCDDSVARVVSGVPRLLRRARGYAPAPIRLPFRCGRPMLALGGHIKSVFALGRGDHAFLSPHLGDLDDWNAFRAFREAVARYEALFELHPEVIAHDLHPGYATTEYAQERQRGDMSHVRVVAVQHHHAHMASCMAENGLTGPILGVTFDGTGYGSDGSVWGGEFLVGGYETFRRAAHLRPVRLPGGACAVREPWRMAVAHVIDCGEDPEPFARSARRDGLRVVRRLIEAGLHAPWTSSMGRLFDAVASLLGLHDEVSFEGQAALALEALALTSNARGAFPFEVEATEAGEARVIDTRPLVRALLAALARGDERAAIARRFHETVAEMIRHVLVQLRQQTAIEDIVLTGGVFQNALLIEETQRRLQRLGFRVHSQARVPCNDGGLALGQLAIAAAWEGHR